MRRILTDADIQEARALKEAGKSNRFIALKFKVGKTTIWDNVFREQQSVIRKHTFSGLNSVIVVVKAMKREEFISKDTAEILGVPLEEVNFIYGQTDYIHS